MDTPADATFTVRLSLVSPKPVEDEHVSLLQDDLLEHFSTQAGYVRGYKLLSGDPQDRCGRLTVWKSEQEADVAANTQRVLSLRSELMLLIEEGSHVERSYTAFDPQLAKTLAP